MRFDFEVVFIDKVLYGMLPDKTMVYPGHGKFTDIGSEKLENSRISIYGGDWL